MLLIIDNYDSFTYNIFQALAVFSVPILVKRNDEITAEEIGKLAPKAIVLSPGPSRPEKSGVSIEAVKKFRGEIPILGVCLGHQIIAAAYGADIGQAARILHGKISPVFHSSSGILKGLPSPFNAVRYHSLAVTESTLSTELFVTARDPDGEIMGLCHQSLPLFGVQFHPESILSTGGELLFKNFLKTAKLI